MDWLDRIITLYVFICEAYKDELHAYCERFSNYSDLLFSDEEVLVIYMCGIMDGKRTKKHIYNHAKDYWSYLFPKLPSYVAFVQRINKIQEVFIPMIARLQAKLPEVFSRKSFKLWTLCQLLWHNKVEGLMQKLPQALQIKTGTAQRKICIIMGSGFM